LVNKAITGSFPTGDEERGEHTAPCWGKRQRGPKVILLGDHYEEGSPAPGRLYTRIKLRKGIDPFSPWQMFYYGQV